MFYPVSYADSTLSIWGPREQQTFLETITSRIQSPSFLWWINRGVCIYIYVYINVHSQLGMPYTKVQQLRLWILESKCIMKLQYLCLKPIMINYKLSLMGNAPLWVLWKHSGWIRTRCWFHLDFCPYIHRTAVLALFAFAAEFISVSASVHGQESASAFFYGTSTAVSPLYIAWFFAAPACFLQQLCFFFSCLLCQTHIYM